RMSDLIGENKRAVEEQARSAEVMAREAERVRDIGAQVMRATEEETDAEGGIAQAVETIDTEARRMRDQLAAKRHEVDLIATATATMREIAHENDSVAQDLTVTVGVLASRADEFEREVYVSPPYFIPAPVVPWSIGTMGAFIRLRTVVSDRRQLLDVGIAGPIAGLVVALPVLAIGLAMSHAPTARASPSGMLLGLDDSYAVLGDSILTLAP